MTNFEKYAEEIKKVIKEKQRFAVTKDGKVAYCVEMHCNDCKFYCEGSCNNNRLEWLYEDAEKTKDDVLEEIYKDYVTMCNQQNCDDCPYKREQLKASCEMAFMYDYLKEKGVIQNGKR